MAYRLRLQHGGARREIILALALPCHRLVSSPTVGPWSAIAITAKHMPGAVSSGDRAVAGRTGASHTRAVLLQIVRAVAFIAMQHDQGDVRAIPTSIGELRLRVRENRDDFYRDAAHAISGGLRLTTSDERNQFVTAGLCVGSPGQQAEVEVML